MGRNTHEKNIVMTVCENEKEYVKDILITI